MLLRTGNDLFTDPKAQNWTKVGGGVRRREGKGTTTRRRRRRRRKKRRKRKGLYEEWRCKYGGHNTAWPIFLVINGSAN